MNKKRLIRLIQRDHALRSTRYLNLMIASAQAGSMIERDVDNPYTHFYVPAFPLVVGITRTFARLEPEAYAAWQRGPTSQELRDGIHGLVLGSSGIMLVLAIAAAKGWVTAPAWAWQLPSVTVGDTGLAMLLWIGQTVLCVYNEEMVFRGYGLDSLRAAVGLPAALAILAVLFAMVHGYRLTLKQFLWLCMVHCMFSLIRLDQGHLWGAAGLHYGWNIVQMALFRPLEHGLSLRPLELHGSPTWIGRPGNPDPGWLHIIVNALMLLYVALRWWRRGRRT